ncbi:MAG: hypothetical protein J7619_07475 [Dyadobacter sp.]|uniref:hypothetical protein n=1 Tax=Dyadobacter sp. TaxID=1914288 RepID=UPI001B2DE1B7|nr:hypothetical protein [Dyadobacter sp.]MBO9612517.1 hypothetical protein [Dyadobacter sp.]
MFERFSQYLDYKGITAYVVENEIGLSRGALYKSIRLNSNISSAVLAKIAVQYPDLNIIWLLTGKGGMTNSSQTSLPFNPDGTPLAGGEQSLLSAGPDQDKNNNWSAAGFELIKRENSTEFWGFRGGVDRYLITTPLMYISRDYGYDYYAEVWDDLEEIDLFARHAVAVESVKFGLYRSFYVNDSGLNSNDEDDLRIGDIVTGIRIEPKNRRIGLSTAHLAIITAKQGVFVRKIKNLNISASEVELASTHPDQSKFPAITLPFTDIFEIYEIVAITRYRNPGAQLPLNFT